VGLGIADYGFMSLFNQEREIEIDNLNSIRNPQSAIRNPQSASPGFHL
jgi:hypothetical protein